MLISLLNSLFKRLLRPGRKNLDYSFKGLNSPTPMMPPVPYTIEWENYNLDAVSNPAPFSFTSVVYLMSPTQRSGTNYLSYLLELHPDLGFPQGNYLPNEQFLLSYANELECYIKSTVEMWGHWLKDCDNVTVSTHSHELFSHFGEGLIQYFSRFIDQNQTLLLRTPDALGIERFQYLFPNGKAVVLIRDGRDTVESFMKSWGGRKSFGKMSKRWAERANRIISFRNNNPNRCYLVKYDALVNNTEEELRKLFKDLGLSVENYPWHKALNSPVLGSSVYHGVNKGVSWNPVTKDRDFKPNKKWHRWSERDKRRFKKYAGKELIDLNFETNMNW